MKLSELLGKPLGLHELPYPFNRGGKQYLAGYEACREKCRSKYNATGNIDGVFPILKVDEDDLTSDKRLYIDGHNELLFTAHRLMEE